MDNKDTSREIRKAQIVYFSGTGGTKRVASCFESVLVKNNIDVRKKELNLQIAQDDESESEESTDLLIILFPVYACDAPEPIYEWINRAPDRNGTSAAVISVSGGGEVFPNTASRVGCIKMLESKGYDVLYEQMLVIPSNIFIGIHDHLAMRLLQLLPQKVEKIVSDIMLGNTRRTRPQLSSSIVTAVFSKIEKKSVKEFRKYLEIKDTCTGCGWCERHCPRKNIQIENNRPSYGTNCTACLNCVYGCPSNSIRMKRYEYFTVKEGYNLDELEKRMRGIELEPAEKFCTGIFWGGVRKYLFEEDK